MTGKFRPFTGFSTIPRGRRLVVIVWVFVGIVICLLTAAVYSVELLAAGRAFVGAEGQWARAQKDAAFHLTRYALTSADEDYRAFERAMAVPLGDRKARDELLKPEPDFAAARAGFLAGRNHPQDIEAMMTLFRRFAPFGPVKQAVFLWQRADATLDDLRAVGTELYKLGPTIDERERRSQIERIARLNATLAGLE